ncbi:hypothetical protein D3C80_790420 [compost metagenome]
MAANPSTTPTWQWPWTTWPTSSTPPAPPVNPRARCSPTATYSACSRAPTPGSASVRRMSGACSIPMRSTSPCGKYSVHCCTAGAWSSCPMRSAAAPKTSMPCSATRVSPCSTRHPRRSRPCSRWPARARAPTWRCAMWCSAAKPWTCRACAPGSNASATVRRS